MTWKQTTLIERSDEELILGIVNDPDRAVCELYRRHANAARGRAMQILGDRSLAEGVVQEVFLRIWQHPESFDPSRGSVRTYVMMLSRSRAIEQRRSSSARRRREERCASDLEHRDAEASPEAEVEALVIAGHLHCAVTRLSDIERTAIEAAYFDDHSYADVAKILGYPEGTVKTRIRSGLVHLRASMGPEVTVDLR